MDYVTFLLDLAGDGDNRAIRATVAYRRAPKLRPKDAFQWKVTCDIHGKIYVAGLVRGKARILASARWHAGVLAEHKQREPTTPTRYQWNLVEVALREELARRAAMHDRSLEPPITRDQQVEEDVGLDAELVEAPPEVLAPEVPYEPVRELDERKVRLAPRDWVADRWRTRMLAFGLGGAVLAIGIIVVVVIMSVRPSVEERATAAKAISPPPTPPPPPPPQPPVVVDEPVEVRITKAATFTEAIALAKPAMVDTTEEMGGGKQQLASYAAHKLRWADVDVGAETTVGRVLKDPELERGKRMCADGTIVTIERRDLQARRIYVGSLRLDDDDAVAFVAVGTTGDLVKRSAARFCGAVTGKAGSAVAMVGMFDLPENRTPLVEQ